MDGLNREEEFSRGDELSFNSVSCKDFLSTQFSQCRSFPSVSGSHPDSFLP